ncbi:VOC family protein [Isachenkonia alkalipeptolytica]|uniref:Glyoxalase n=1 Tax=Isachenkonia alkalipeptolytica TaxID=2565777 RepID=A0AA44BGN0_9CLOT|nr:VOC family protein [Isachenkonia alkalipeptolytica]NBG89441.1 glyoxalase [Isachenkonia alkalipeptolytica]
MKEKDQGLIVFLGTKDLDATHGFYHEVLGFSLYKDQGLCRIYDVEGGGKLGFCEHIETAMNEKSPIITLVVEDVDAYYERLINKSVEVAHPPRENPKFKIYHFFLEDPNGYTLEIQKFL